MSNINKIKDYLYDWLSEFAEFRFANQSVGVSKYPFIICSLRTINKKGFDQILLNLQNEEVINYGLREFNISLDIYDSEDGNALQISQNIIDSIDSIHVRNLFKEINVVFESNIIANDLTSLLKSFFEQRIHFDIIAKYTSNIKDKIDVIDLNNVEVKGVLNVNIC